MKKAVEIVDEIIEELAFGEIESDLLTQAPNTGSGAQGWANAMSKIADAMQEYLAKGEEEDKKELAEKILRDILNLRLVGFLKNNPNSVKQLRAERDFYKERVSLSEADIEKLRTDKANLAEALRVETEKRKVPGTA